MSDQQGSSGQLRAGTPNVYQFTCALRLLAKPQLEKESPLGIQQKNQFPFISFFILSLKTMRFRCPAFQQAP